MTGIVLNEEKDGKKHRFITDAAAVGQEVPEYAEFVRGQIDTRRVRVRLVRAGRLLRGLRHRVPCVPARLLSAAGKEGGEKPSLLLSLSTFAFLGSTY